MRRKSSRRPSPAMVVALVAVLVATAGSATAATLITSRDIQNGAVRKVDLNRSLVREIEDTVFAQVDADATLSGGRGVRSVGRTPDATEGDYRVTFAWNLRRCAPVASVRGVQPSEFYGFITTYIPSANTVRVVVRNAQGTKADSGFNLAVVC